MTINNVSDLAEHCAPEIPCDEEWHAQLREVMKPVRDACAARQRGDNFTAATPVSRFSDVAVRSPRHGGDRRVSHQSSQSADAVNAAKT
jgi:hypothetical protein